MGHYPGDAEIVALAPQGNVRAKNRHLTRRGEVERQVDCLQLRVFAGKGVFGGVGVDVYRGARVVAESGRSSEGINYNKNAAP